ncbi:uncharacterized protein PG986_009741 [Apiospora aurea]|uniref:Major facilitator superfamily (MFS) profile domain-containing protein n=1 Tax=Apiospora aurea TaxID=335848 RepID=A0ABR1Q8K8_9PEZI
MPVEEKKSPGLDLEAASLSEDKPPVNALHVERAELLANLPDPDADKTPEERAVIDRKLMWKVDVALIPWLSLLYLMSFLDRTNIGNARLAGMEDDLGMKGQDYNMTLTIFFISYAAAEPVTNALLKRLSPRVFFTAIIFVWGVTQTLMGIVHNYPGLLAARFFLGIAEAGLFPGVNYYLSCWYKSSEIGVRSAIFFSAAALAGSFGGIATVLVGIGCWWMVFDWPEDARFLSADDRIRMQRRLIADRQGRTAEDFDKRHIWAALRDWKTYGYMFIYSGALVPLYAFSLFLPTILKGMGHVGTRAQLLSVPPYAVAAALTVIVGFVADATKYRGYCNAATVLVGISGFVMLLASQNPQVQYAGTFLGAAGIYPTISNTLSWVINNTEGSLKRAVVLGMVVGFGNLNGVVSSNIYLTREAPRFWTGHGVVLGYQVVALLGGTVVMHAALRKMNRDRTAGRMDAKWAAMGEEERWAMGDIRPDFKYTL